ALARCSASGLGPSLGEARRGGTGRREDAGIVILRALLWRPPDRNQRLQQPCGAFGKRRIGGHGCQLVLPQIDITPGERGKIGRFRHGGEYTGARDHGARAKSHNRLCWLRHAAGEVSTMSDTSGAETPPIVIKKYANRRLYNTATSSYVTLDDLSRMVKAHNDFVVYDAKTGE